jgi:hypothetical protein
MLSAKHVDSAINFSSSPDSHAERTFSGFDLAQLSQQHMYGLEKLVLLVEDPRLPMPLSRR